MTSSHSGTQAKLDAFAYSPDSIRPSKCGVFPRQQIILRSNLALAADATALTLGSLSNECYSECYSNTTRALANRKNKDPRRKLRGIPKGKEDPTSSRKPNDFAVTSPLDSPKLEHIGPRRFSLPKSRSHQYIGVCSKIRGIRPKANRTAPIQSLLSLSIAARDRLLRNHPPVKGASQFGTRSVVEPALKRMSALRQYNRQLYQRIAFVRFGDNGRSSVDAQTA